MNRRLRGGRAIATYQRPAGGFVCVAAALLATLSACGSSNQPTGSLYVKVLDKSNAPVADAVVTTEPKTSSMVTDALGSVFFAKIAAGGYAVTATHPTAGSGRATVQVKASDVADATVVLTGPPLGNDGGAGAGGQGGTSGTGGAAGTTGAGGVGGTGQAGTGGTTGAGGVAGTTGAAGHGGSGGGAGTTGSGGAGGTAGGHGGSGGGAGTTGAGGVAGHGGTGGSTAGSGGSLAGAGGSSAGAGGSTAGAGGSSGGTGGSSTATIVLAALTKDTNGVNLSWTSTPANAFATIRVYRNSSVINILQDGTSVGYRDDSVQLGVSYTYKVGGVTAGGQEIQSNSQTITTGVYIDVGSQIERMMVDPTRPWLYGVDKVNNSLHFINLTTNTVDKTIFVGSTPVDLDINLEDTTLYVANFGSTQIATVDLDSQTMTGSIFVDTSLGNWQGNPYRLACTAGDTLVFTSEDQWNDLKLVNALTGASLDVTGSIYEPDLVASPDGVSVYAGESGISTETLYRYDIVNGKLTSVDQSAGINQFTGNTVLMSKDGKYVYYAQQKFLAKNLKSVLGTFSEGIVAINSDGSLAIGASHIFDGTTFAAKRATPISSGTMAVSPDDKTLYMYDTTTSRIYIYQLQ